MWLSWIFFFFFFYPIPVSNFLCLISVQIIRGLMLILLDQFGDLTARFNKLCSSLHEDHSHYTWSVQVTQRRVRNFLQGCSENPVFFKDFIRDRSAWMQRWPLLLCLSLKLPLVKTAWRSITITGPDLVQWPHWWNWLNNNRPPAFNRGDLVTGAQCCSSTL